MQSASHRKAVSLVALGRCHTDITDSTAVGDALHRFAPDIVVNAAAFTKVDAAESDPETAWKVNCDGAGIVATECAAARVPLIHVSTDYVFDGTKSTPYTETDGVAPLGEYGNSKEAGERAVRESCSRHIILRTAWLYGCHGANFLKTIVKLAFERDELRVVADQIGNPTATEDLANAVLVAGARACSSGGIWGTYHFAGSGEASWHDFATEIVQVQARWTGRLPAVTAIGTLEYPTPAKRPANSRLDSTRMSAAFGVKAVPWRNRVPTIVEAVLEQMGVVVASMPSGKPSADLDLLD
jgi:dTDP-4-dehydrorhamnose reductase